jgi:hypothetical protein
MRDGENCMTDTVRDNKARHRFEIDVDGGVAVANYRLEPGAVALTHTEVPGPLQGQGIGSRLVRAVLEKIRADGLKVVPRCSFVSAYLARHPEFNDLVQ